MVIHDHASYKHERNPIQLGLWHGNDAIDIIDDGIDTHNAFLVEMK